MKKFSEKKFIFGIILCFSVILNGCSSGKENDEVISEQDTEAEAMQETETQEEESGFEITGAVYSGDSTTSIIDAQGNLLICGNNESGQLGDTKPSNKSTYSLVASNIRFVNGEHSFAAVSTDNKLYTWGGNSENQLGYGSGEDSSEPTQIEKEVVDAAITSSVCAFVTKTGELYAMGYARGIESFGDDRYTRASGEPVKIMDHVIDIELSTNNFYGFVTFAAITENYELYMWGDNAYGIIDPENEDDVAKPMKIMDNIQSISLGDDFALAISTENELYAWGKNSFGQLGIGNKDVTEERVKVMDNVIVADAGTGSALAINEYGELFTWGLDSYGELGQGIDSKSNNDEVVLPAKIMDGVKSASIDGSTMIILTQSGDVYTCGWNYDGQLGTGDREDRNVPTWVYNIYESTLPEMLKSENAGIVEEDYFDEMDKTDIAVEINGENLTVNMEIDHLYDFVKYNGGSIDLMLSDGNIALMFKFEVEDNEAEVSKYVHVLVQSNFSEVAWMGAGWQDVSCQLNGNVLSWSCTLPSGSFSPDTIQYVEARIHTSRSREHISTYQLINGSCVYLGNVNIEEMDVAVPAGEGYHKYIN